MRLKLQTIIFSFILSALSLQAQLAHALVLETPQQEQQAASAEKNDNSEPAESKKPAATQSNKTKSSADVHQHDVIINPPVNAFEQQQQDIKHYLAQEKITPLQVGPDNYLTVINQYTTAMNKGVMVLIPDWQQSIATPNALNQLRKNMPQQGWTTITLHPPHKPENYPSKALTTEERSTENNASLTNYGKKFAEIMSALIAKAKSYPGIIVVVAEGNHSAILLDIYQQALVDTPSALVMLSSYMPTLPENEKIAQQLALTDYPILDLYLKRDHRLVLAQAEKRKNAAKREMKVYYRQRKLNNHTTGYYPKNSLTGAIINWLSAIGW